MIPHVLIIVQNLPVPLDRRVWLEACALRDAGFRVSVIAFADKGQPMMESLEGVHILRYPAPPQARGTASYIFEFIYCWLWTAFRSSQLWRRNRFQYIQACNPPETYWLLARFYRLWGVKFVFDHHDLSPEMFVAKGGRLNGLLYRGLLWLERKTFETADLVITTNMSHAGIATGRGGVDPSRVHVVRNGPDTRRLRVVESEPELKRGHRFLVAYLGEMCLQDGVDHLIEAARIISFERKREDVAFILIGGGPDLPRLRDLNNELGLGAVVEFTGRASDELLCRVLSSADVCVDPDPLTEWSDRSTMNKIMEYMFFGKPIVAYPLKENTESAGEAALCVPPNDPNELASGILRLLDSEAERRERGEFGYDRVRQSLMWDASKPRLIAAYKSLT